MARGYPQGLTPLKKGSERAKKVGAMGGFTKGDKLRKNKGLEEIFNTVLTMPMKNGELSGVVSIEDVSTLAQRKELNLTVQETAALAIAAQAVNGDVQAMKFIRDTAGQAPVERVIEDKNIDKTSALVDGLLADVGTFSLDEDLPVVDEPIEVGEEHAGTRRRKRKRD